MRDPFLDDDGVIRVPGWYTENQQQRTQELLNRAAEEIVEDRYTLDDPGEADTDIFLLQMIRGHE